MHFRNKKAKSYCDKLELDTEIFKSNIKKFPQKVCSEINTQNLVQFLKKECCINLIIVQITRALSISFKYRCEFF